MKRILPLLILSVLLSFCLLFTACDDEVPVENPSVDGETDGGENGDTSHLPEFGDNVVDFDTIA